MKTTIELNWFLTFSNFSNVGFRGTKKGVRCKSPKCSGGPSVSEIFETAAKVFFCTDIDSYKSILSSYPLIGERGQKKRLLCRQVSVLLACTN